jgi:uncharacterized protein (TIGR02147 family)
MFTFRLCVALLVCITAFAMTSIDVLNPREFLSQELTKRCQRNPRYSLRSFAQFLGITPSALSMILSGKRNVSKKAAQQIVEALALPPQLKVAFLYGCGKHSDLNFQEEDLSNNYQKLALDTYEIISDWYHFAILSLIETKDFQPKLAWIASRLGITLAEVKTAVERLVRLGILDVSETKWKQTTKPIKVENTVSTAATRKHQRQMIEKALESLEHDPMDIRDMSSMTLAMDPKLVPTALKEIRKFRRKLTKMLETSAPQTEVYHLAIQLYPVSKRK